MDDAHDRYDHDGNGGRAASETCSPVESIRAKAVEAQVIEALRTIYDPEIPINIYDLGLIYGIEVHPDNVVDVRMTLTSPACPEAQSLPLKVESRVRAVDGIAEAKVTIVWEPPWGPDKMSEAARLMLNL